MKESRYEYVQRALREVVMKRPKRPPVPLYQKVLFWIAMLVALFAFVKAMFFR